MTSKDIMIQSDDAGGIIVLRSGDDEKFLKRTTKNSVRCSGIMASALKVMRDDILQMDNLVHDLLSFIDRKGELLAWLDSNGKTTDLRKLAQGKPLAKKKAKA
jgi:hypothetical protein